jgi:hypothetical protein
MPRATPSERGVEPPPAAGAYVVLARAGATPTAEDTRDISFVHEAGQELMISETVRLPDGRWRGTGPNGWVSFISERGTRLLAPAGPPLDAAPPASKKQWASFYERAGFSGSASVDAGAAMRAVEEFLPGWTPQVLAAHSAVGVSAGGMVSRRELEALMQHHAFFMAHWTKLQKLRQRHGDRLHQQAFILCCHAMGERLSLGQAGRAFDELSKQGQSGDVPFELFRAWLARRAAGLPAIWTPLSRRAPSPAIANASRTGSPYRVRPEQFSPRVSPSPARRSRSRSPFPRRVAAPGPGTTLTTLASVVNELANDGWPSNLRRSRPVSPEMELDADWQVQP